MQYFTEQAPSHREALEKIRAKYGDSAQVLSHRTVRMGGFLGFFEREGVELTGYIKSETRQERAAAKADLEEEKRKIIAQAKADQALQQPRFHPLAYQAQNHAVTYPLTKYLPELSVVQGVEALPDVDLQDPSATDTHHCLPDGLARLVR